MAKIDPRSHLCRHSNVKTLYLCICFIHESIREPSQITFAFRGGYLGGQKNARFTT